MTEYVSKKITSQGDKILKYVQAHYQLEKGEKATETEVLEMALTHIAEERFGYLKRKKVRRGLGLLSSAGFIKGGKKSSPEEIDKVVYGV